MYTSSSNKSIENILTKTAYIINLYKSMQMLKPK